MPQSVSPPNALYAYVGGFVDELARSGLRHVCICPGSRSTPLALCVAQHPDLKVWMHLDERSAAFFALGLARASREPVALICTSGTAAANFMPAVVGANLANAPLIVLTADRPPELRDVGAAQTIDQIRFYGSHVKWSVEMAAPGGSEELLIYARVSACRAVATAVAVPRGPVHLNFPFREPLVPVSAPTEISVDDSTAALFGRPDGKPYVAVPSQTPMSAPSRVIEDIGHQIASLCEGLIVCGPLDDPEFAEAVLGLAALAGYPILADPLSGLRAYSGHDHAVPAAHPDTYVEHTANARKRPESEQFFNRGVYAEDRTLIVDAYDAMLRGAEAVDGLAPKLVLRLGATTTSKPLLQFLQAHRECRQIVVARGTWPDPALLAADMIDADPSIFCRDLARLLIREHLALREGPDPVGNHVRTGESEFTEDRARTGDPGIHSGEHSSLAQRGIYSANEACATFPPLAPASLATASAPPTSAPDRRDRDWLDRWIAANRRAREALSREMADMDELFEGRVFAELAPLLPAHATLWVGSSMPVRDLDTFFPVRDRPMRFLANRGANGIDGVVSSALGAAASASGPTVLAIGDISFYHDMNGLLAAARHGLALTVVLINNDGGGIFSFLPQATTPPSTGDDATDHFELLFGTPHGLDFSHAAALYGATFTRVADWPDFRAAVLTGMADGGLHIVEVPTDRGRNVVLHRRCWPAVADAVHGVLEGG